MRDIIVIGKKTHSRFDEPVVVYCGQDLDAARAAVAAARNDFARFYHVNPEPHAPFQVPEAPPIAPAVEVVPEPVVEVVEPVVLETVDVPQESKKSRKK